MSPEPIISAKTRNELREYFVGTSLRQVTDAFDGANVRCDTDHVPTVHGQRRSLVKQYYRTVTWSDWKSVSRVVKVFESVLRDLYAPVPDNTWGAQTALERRVIADKLLYWIRQDGFEWVGSKLIRTTSTSNLEELNNATHRLEGNHIAQQIQRMRDAVESDPTLAIGTAKELIETVCKTILEERGQPAVGSPDIPTLTKALLKELRLVPDSVEDSRRGADTIKGILRSLGSIGNDLAQLRSLYGTGHGKTAKTQALRARHARLAVGAAATFVTFVFETHLETASEKQTTS